MENRTDLAVESFEEKENTKLNGIIVKKDGDITTVQVINEHGEKAIGKPVGTYITCQVPSFINDTDIFDGRLNLIADILHSLLPADTHSVLVAGLGNSNITADALGPKTNNYVLATRHIVDDLKNSMGIADLKSVSTVTTGVLAQTGIETAEIIRGVVHEIHPSCLIVVDALASTSAERLGTTVQLSDSGISPGSGVGNHRFEISQKTMNVPVISMGIPTVVSTGMISGNSADDMFVTPREIDRVTEQGAKLIGMSINVCLQQNLSPSDLFALVG